MAAEQPKPLPIPDPEAARRMAVEFIRKVQIAAGIRPRGAPTRPP